MAITAVLATDTPTLKRWNVTATLDADVTMAVSHGMEDLPGYDPDKLVFWTNARIASARLSLWTAAVGPDPTTIAISKATTLLSGAPGVQMDLIVMLPHSIL